RSQHGLQLRDARRHLQELGPLLHDGLLPLRLRLRVLAKEQEAVRPCQAQHPRSGRQAMAQVERDPVTGRDTTGHEGNGITELDTPVPRGVLLFLIVTHVWAIAWWFFAPTWPLGTTYTKGLLGIDQRTTLEARMIEGQEQRAFWTSRLESEPYDAILADEALM